MEDLDIAIEVFEISSKIHGWDKPLTLDHLLYLLELINDKLDKQAENQENQKEQQQCKHSQYIVTEIA